MRSTPLYAPDGLTSAGGDPERFAGIRRDYTPEDVERLSGHVVAIVGGEERDDVRDIVTGFHPAHRHLAGEEFPCALAIGAAARAHHLQKAFKELRLDEAGTHRIDGDAELTQLQREAARQPDDAVLCRRIRRHPRAAALAGDRRSIDDAAAPSALNHLGRDVFRA